ncbi:MAG: hypothetical protein AAFQ52_13165, partial [Chloroflexota bacterium]
SITFVFVCFAWIFFRANSLADAQYVIAHLLLFDASQDIFAPFADGLLAMQTEFYLSMALIAGLVIFDWFDAKLTLPRMLAKTPLVIRWGAYYAITAVVMFSGLYGSGAEQFIYFQF